MEQTVEDRRGQHRVAEHFAPVDEALVGGDDHTGALVAARRQAEEEIGFLAAHRQIAQFINDKQLGRDPLLELPLQPVVALRAAQTGNERLQGEEQHPMASLDRLDAQGHRQHRLAGAQRAEQEQIVAALDETEPGQFAHELAVDRGLKAEIELFERFDVGKARQAQSAFHALEPPPLPFGGERLAQELPVIEFVFGGLLAQRVKLGCEMIELEFGAQGVQLHRATSS
jgi:hypothetical protein